MNFAITNCVTVAFIKTIILPVVVLKKHVETCFILTSQCKDIEQSTTKMEDSQVDQIFAGDLRGLPPWKQPLIRIYLSSTFTDMCLEKAAIYNEVYPKLKEYSREQYGVEFQVMIVVKLTSKLIFLGKISRLL